MKAKELYGKDLMIGDWLYSIIDRYDHIEKKPIKITGIRTDGNELLQGDDSDVWYHIETYEPIPLTAEILEKNGFYWGYTASEEDFCSATGCGYPEEKGWSYDEGAGEIKILFPNNGDGGLIRLDDQCGDRHLEVVFVKPIMLHELQHLLRMVGIEKEIEP